MSDCGFDTWMRMVFGTMTITTPAREPVTTVRTWGEPLAPSVGPTPDQNSTSAAIWCLTPLGP